MRHQQPAALQTTIIIPVKNNWQYTNQCLKSIFAYTDAGTYEIILVDNGSTDETRSAITKQYSLVNILEGQTDWTYSQANNAAASLSNTPYLLFLNNDTVVTENWLPPLLEELESNATTAAVGPRLVYPNGEIQQAGIVFDHNKTGVHFGAFYSKEHRAVTQKKHFTALTAACLLIKKKNFLAVGGFDESYRFGMEDLDLCLKLGKEGAKLRYVPASTVIHYESRTAGRFKYAKQNIDLFLSRWAENLRPNEFQYIAELRAVESGLGTIPIIISGNFQPHKYIAILENIYRTSSCACPALVICPEETQSRITRYYSPEEIAPYITFRNATDIIDIHNWLQKQTNRSDFHGLLALYAEGINLRPYWDQQLLQFATQTTAILPLFQDGGVRQGWNTLLRNVYTENNGTVEKKIAVLQEALKGFTLYISQPRGDCIFYPPAVVAQVIEQTDLFIQHKISNPQKAISPQWFVATNKPQPPLTIPAISALIVDNNDKNQLRFWHRSCRELIEAQQIFFIHFTMIYRGDSNSYPKYEEGFSLHIQGPVKNEREAFNMASLFTTSPFLLLGSQTSGITTANMLALLRKLNENAGNIGAYLDSDGCTQSIEIDKEISEDTLKSIADLVLIPRPLFSSCGGFNAALSTSESYSHLFFSMSDRLRKG